MIAIHRAALENLKARDPELYIAVQNVQFDQSVADDRMSIEEWKIRVTKRAGGSASFEGRPRRQIRRPRSGDKER